MSDEINSEASSNNLAQRRFDAACASRGISGGPVRVLVRRLVEKYVRGGSLLDFGAGTGDLVREFFESGNFASVGALDILPRPPELPSDISWTVTDLNLPVDSDAVFDAVVSCELIEHLENPRAMFRSLFALLKPGGIAIITTPNQHSWRSILAYVVKGHFAAFVGSSYPAHITALTRMDLERVAMETGFELRGIYYSGQGRFPGFTQFSWQQVSLGLLRGARFSDTVAVVVQKPATEIPVDPARL